MLGAPAGKDLAYCAVCRGGTRQAVEGSTEGSTTRRLQLLTWRLKCSSSSLEVIYVNILTLIPQTAIANPKQLHLRTQAYNRQLRQYGAREWTQALGSKWGLKKSG